MAYITAKEYKHLTKKDPSPLYRSKIPAKTINGVKYFDIDIEKELDKNKGSQDQNFLVNQVSLMQSQITEMQKQNSKLMELLILKESSTKEDKKDQMIMDLVETQKRMTMMVLNRLENKEDNVNRDDILKLS